MGIKIDRDVFDIEFFLRKRSSTTQRFCRGELSKQPQVRLDGRPPIGKAISNVIGRFFIESVKERLESIGTQERIVRADTDKAIEPKCLGSTNEAIEHVILIAAKAVNARLAGHLLQHVVLRADGRCQYHLLVRTGPSDVFNKNVNNALLAIEREQYLVVQPGRAGTCLNDNSVFHIFIRLKASI